MPVNNPTRVDKKETLKRSLTQPTAQGLDALTQQVNLVAASQRAIVTHPSYLNPSDVLTLQQVVGNLVVQRMLVKDREMDSWTRTTKGVPIRQSAQVTHFTPMPIIQRGLLDSLRRGARMYFGMNDEGASYARQLLEWRILGFGADFVRVDGNWGRFMAGRPEIQRAMATKFATLAQGFAMAGPGSGTFTDSVTGVRLNELESMRLTLHGCHRIDISGSYEVTDSGGNRVFHPNNRMTMTVKSRPQRTDSGSSRVVRLSNVRFTWVDRADLHPGTVTELDTGERVDDREFTAAGWDYDIRIYFGMPRTSTWRVSGGRATHERGWPPVTGAPAAGFRG